VTHLVWPGNTTSYESLASELRFLTFATLYTENTQTFHSHRLAAVPRTPPQNPASEPVLYLGCTGYEQGLYELNDLHVVAYLPPPDTRYPRPRIALNGADAAARVQPLIKDALAVVRNRSCGPAAGVEPGHYGFSLVKNRDQDELWIRQRR
jgi:hypothetical protein